MGVVATSAAITILAAPSAVSGQSQGTCAGGWAASCASVEVAAEGDRLFFYVPNAVPSAGPTVSGVDSRVRIYQSSGGATCDVASGIGCEDVTAAWTGADPDPEAEARCAAGDVGADTEPDPGGEAARTVSEDNGRAAAAPCSAGSGVRGEEAEGDRRRGPGATAFAVTIPPAAFLWLSGDGDASVSRSTPESVGSDGDDEAGEGSGFDGELGNEGEEGDGDSGESGDSEDSGEAGEGGNGSAGNGGNGSAGNGGNGSSGNGNNSNNSGNGSDGGSQGFAPLDSGQQPPMSSVPEPLSTTLVGLGLLGYAGTRLRHRHREGQEADETS